LLILSSGKIFKSKVIGVITETCTFVLYLIIMMVMTSIS